MTERIGFFVCHCGVNIASKVRVKEVAEYASTFPGVVVAKDYLFMCSDPGQDLIEKDIKEHNLTRIVVAACSPRMHEKTFRTACERGGLNPYNAFHMVCVREHGSWVTESEDEATTKAIVITRAGLRRVSQQEALHPSTVPVNPASLVVGGGIAGMQAALDIASAGNQVYLVEKQATVGGHMLQYDKTFPTLDCAACIGTPKMVAVGQNKNIELLTYSEVESVSGFVGNFKARIKKHARYVKSNCTGCGDCATVCPVMAPNEWDVGTKRRKAIYIPFPQAVPVQYVIDKHEGKGGCIDCGKCEKECKAGAIDHDQVDEILEVEIGSIIVATGFDTMDPSVMPQYGYGKHRNVLTNLEFERISNATGPTAGKLLKRSMKNKMKYTEPPKSVAILHCIGSRDLNHHEYCSRTCCMYGLKYAHLLKDKLGHDTEVYNFYIDMRCFGKGYEEFYRKVQEEGVKMIRGKAGSVTEDADGMLTVIAEDSLSGSMVQIEVEMVILCTAMEARSNAEDVMRTFGIGIGADGFFQEEHPKLAPVSTPSSGVFLAGTCQGPKDIPDTVAQAKGAACECLALSGAGQVEIPPMISFIDGDICVGCQLCIGLCPYGAIEFNEFSRISAVNSALCKGCGSCAGGCPSGAAKVKHFTDKQVFAEIDGLLTL
ncbi:MAG: CoB--CoM heterodisulfide reductase iron-sulfur subunit A family protein [Desulfotalea sp.]